MASPLFDPKKYTHISSDKEKTVLKHEMGHTITFAHKALSKDMRAQLEALIPKEMADGGKVEDATIADSMPKSAREGVFGEKAKQKQEDKEAKEIDKASFHYKNNVPAQPMAVGGTVEGEVTDSEEPPLTQEQVNAMLPAEPVTFDTTPPDAPIAPDYTGMQAQSPMSDAIALRQDEAQSLGLAGTPERSLADSSTMPDLGQMSSSVPTTAMPGAGNPYAAQAKTIGDLGNKQAEILERAQKSQAELAAKWEETSSRMQSQFDQISQEYADGQINPDQYWTGDKDGQGGHSKIAAAIGILLAGFNPTNTPNMAAKFIDQQIDRNIDAQKENLGKKRTLLEANMRQFGNLKDAMLATKVNLNDAVINELKIAEAKAQTPLAKAAAQIKMQELMAQRQPMLQKLAIGSMVAQMRSGKMSPEAVDEGLNQLEMVDPDRAKELRAVHVPGLGFASSLEGAKGVREMQATTKTVADSIKRLKELTKKTGKSMNPNLRAEVNTIRNGMIGRLRIPMTGPGAMNEGERKLMENMIPGVADLFSLDSRSMRKLETLDKIMNSNFESMARANGLKVQSKEQQQSPQAALAWAQANPQDPRAKKILQLHGQ